LRFFPKKLQFHNHYMDEVFRQIDRALLLLDSDQKVHGLIETVTAISPTWDHVAQSVLLTSRLVGPSRSLFLVKFMHLLGKKDMKFFVAIKGFVASVVVSCFQVAGDREDLKLYVTSWLMNNQWKQVAEQSLSAIVLFENRYQLEPILHELQKTDMGIASKRRPELDMDSLHYRLDAVVRSLNVLYSIAPS
jgi:hypothetical protein